ncbi:MAG TPA: hypothetical protein VK588_02515 [Chitinophagaceae bacterium]|nr:hypothetical protein [Chitinophagaceae bacterium]
MINQELYPSLSYAPKLQRRSPCIQNPTTKFYGLNVTLISPNIRLTSLNIIHDLCNYNIENQ